MFRWYFDKKRNESRRQGFSSNYYKKTENNFKSFNKGWQKRTVDILVDGKKIGPGDPRYKEAIKNADKVFKESMNFLDNEMKRLDEIDDLFNKLFKD